MNALQPTPGPWEVRCNPTNFVVRQVGGPIVCSMSWHWSNRENYTLQHESEANANLIAAAPELLAVVRDFRGKLATYVGVYQGDKQLRRQLTDCDAVIAKATRDTP